MNKNVLLIILALCGLVFLLFFNPLSWNDAGYRTIVTSAGGTQSVQTQPGIFISGFFAKTVEWPNQLSIVYSKDKAEDDLENSSMEIGRIPCRFSRGQEALLTGIVQFILPNNEKEMLMIHNTHKTPEHLIKNRLMPYTKECLQSSTQLLTVEAHINGGRSQLSQDYLNQLQNGAYLIEVKESVKRDSITGEYKTVYTSSPKLDKDGNILRKYSSIKEYNITVADAQITDVDYSALVDDMITKNIESVTRASVSKQNLITAQQEALTAKAEGEKQLVAIEYEKKKEQTTQVVEAQTKVEVAKQDLLQQEIARQASVKEAAKIKTLADAKAYEKQRIMQADGALEKKLAAWTSAQEFWAKAFGEYTGNVAPQWVSGTAGPYANNAAVNFMEIMGAKAARDLNLDMNNKK